MYVIKNTECIGGLWVIMFYVGLHLYYKMIHGPYNINFLSYLVKTIFRIWMVGCSKRPSKQTQTLIVTCAVA